MFRLIKQIDTRIMLVVVSLLAVGWLQWPRLGDELRVDEDFRSFYWMHRFQDEQLFPNDDYQGYQNINLPWGNIPVTFFSLGYALLFYLASFAMSPILFSKVLPFALMPVTVLYLFEFGRSARNRQSGVVLALGFLFVNLASSSAISIANGLQRSFAVMLTIMLIYHLRRGQYFWAAVVTLLSSLIYAPTFALAAAIWGVFALWRNRRPQLQTLLKQGGLGYLLLTLCAGAVVLAPVLLPILGFDSAAETNQPQPESPAGPALSIWENPAYQTGGAYPLFIIFPVVGRGGLVDLGEDLINLLILALVGGLIWLARGRRALNLPAAVWCLLAATIAMFALSWLAIWLTNSFVLYLPSRYTRVGLYLFLIMFVFLNAADFVKEAPQLLRRDPRRLAWLVAGVELVIVGLIIFYPPERAMIGRLNMKWLLALAGAAFGLLGVALVKNPPQPAVNLQPAGKRLLVGAAIALFVIGWAVYAPLLTEVSYLNPPPAERKLLQFLATLPKDTLIAGTPCALDSVQLFARRQVLFSCEQPREAKVVNDALKAYYADDPQVIAQFCREYGVDYLVVDSNAYSNDFLARGEIFFEPYNREVQPYLASQSGFALAQVADDFKLFESENYFVMACSRLTAVN